MGRDASPLAAYLSAAPDRTSRRVAIVATVGFFAFGVSDVWEVFSGTLVLATGLARTQRRVRFRPDPVRCLLLPHPPVAEVTVGVSSRVGSRGWLTSAS